MKERKREVLFSSIFRRGWEDCSSEELDPEQVTTAVNKRTYGADRCTIAG